ncbi:hypothetical protein JCM19235_5253 [Vibrio maritimus]|uniref:Uncharacterized protein n=1 Tax=Vibrio maritimus TaxID=990268 RepID=A0A090RR48_9VIBR|nr:hypothetical protein JCM19235_5253 [Vibrio maritimus]
MWVGSVVLAVSIEFKEGSKAKRKKAPRTRRVELNREWCFQG